MSQIEAFKPLSLAQHFEAPDDFVGYFGWICGYSADARFLNDAAERFMRKISSVRRTKVGSITMAIMLDPGNPYISLIDAPGVLHLPMLAPEKKAFSLLHAKVALLGFRHNSDANKWRLRLIVSTGNWTRETLEDSLDLVWRIDISSEELTEKSPNEKVKQSCADIKAAWDFLSWLRESFDTRALLAAVAETGKNTETSDAYRRFDEWLDIVKNIGSVNPRFFDNREQPLLKQLPALIEATGSSATRNYLALGSGFYESPNSSKAIPSVLKNIVGTLQNGGKKSLLHKKSPIIDIFVNPLACQAVAGAVSALNEAQWNVRAAVQPAYFGSTPQRSLHAKFIFSADYRAAKPNCCTKAWLYLGSGNLTKAGFTHKMSPQNGNLEAGVLFGTNTIYWQQEKGITADKVITNILPIHRNNGINSLPCDLSPGGDMPDREIDFIAAPIAWLYWHSDGDTGWLQTPDGICEPFEVLYENGVVCSADLNGKFTWTEGMPRLVRIRWVKGENIHHSRVPVLDKFGRFSATVLPKIDLDEAWWQLANFPMPPEDEELLPDNGYEFLNDEFSSDNNPPPPTSSTAKAIYPIRQMMQLIESIAEKQIAISEVDWPTWCVRLEQCLTQASDSPVLNAFSELNINPLSPLWHKPFRPDFAETNKTAEGTRYEEVLSRIEKEWKVQTFARIGSLP